MKQQQEIPPELKDVLESLRVVPTRDRRIAARRRQDYLNLVDRLPVRGWQRLLHLSPRLARLAVTALLLVVMLGATTVTALAAQRSLPGSMLYPVKIGLEEAQLALTTDAVDRFGLLQALTARRFNEMDTLVAANEPLPAILNERLEAHYQNLISLSADLDDATLAQSLIGLQDMLQVRERLMTVNAGQPSDPVYAIIRQRVQEMNQLAQAGLVDPNQFRWQYENHNGGGTGTPSPGFGPGPDAGPGPGAPPTQAPAASKTPAPAQNGPGATPTPGDGQGSGGTPTGQSDPGQNGSGGTPTDQPVPTQGQSGGTPTGHPSGGKP